VVSDGVLVHEGGSGVFWFGPYASLPKGDYTAKFWLKLNKAYTGTILDLEITDNINNEMLANSTISGSDFESINTWQSFDVPFILSTDLAIVEFSGMNVRNLAPISFFLIEINAEIGELLS